MSFSKKMLIPVFMMLNFLFGQTNWQSILPSNISFDPSLNSYSADAQIVKDAMKLSIKEHLGLDYTSDADLIYHFTRFFAEKVAKSIYKYPSEVPTFSRFDFGFDASTQIAYKMGSAGYVGIRYSPNYVRSFQTGAGLQKELEGSFCHELMHGFQNTPQCPAGQTAYQDGTEFYGYIEGSADWSRYNLGYFTYEARRRKGGSYKSGYTTTGFFYDYICKFCDPDFMYKLNQSCKTITDWTLDKACKQILGAGADELWAAYQKDWDKCEVKFKKTRALFSANKTYLKVGETVTFTSDSQCFQGSTTGVITNLEWKFEGANQSISTSQNPQITYNQTGAFNVTLIATGTVNGITEKDTTTLVKYILVHEDNGLVAHWDFEVSNILGQDNNRLFPISSISGVTQEYGKFGNCAKFSGANSGIILGNHEGLNSTKVQTWSFWIKAAKPLNSSVSIIRHDGHYTPLQVISGFLGGGTWSHPWLQNSGPMYSWGGEYDAFFDKQSEMCFTNDWVHVVTIFEQKSPKSLVKVYINGVLKKSQELIGNEPLATTQTPLVFGCNDSMTGEFFTGCLDEIRVFNIALSEEEIKKLYTENKFKETTTGIEEELPSEYRLGNNYPNPFNPETMIEYSIPREEKVEINIFNSLGQVVEKLVQDLKIAGTHKIKWNAKQYPSGVYFCSMRTGEFSKSIKVLLLK